MNKRFFFIVVFLFFLFPVLPAHAYVDPGVGSLAYQLILATLLGALFYIRRIWKSLFSKKKQTSQINPQDQ